MSISIYLYCSGALSVEIQCILYINVHLGAPCSCCLFTSNVAHMLMAAPRLFATCGSRGDLCLIYASLVVSICRGICLWSAYERGFQQLQPCSCAVLQNPLKRMMLCCSQMLIGWEVSRGKGAKGETIRDEIKKSAFTAQTVAAVDTFYWSQHLISLWWTNRTNHSRQVVAYICVTGGRKAGRWPVCSQTAYTLPP